MIRLIGFSGKAGVGKTTLCNLIRDRLPAGAAVVLSFADALREEVAEMLGYSPEFVRDPLFKRGTVALGNRVYTGREVLQMHGERMRAADPDYWVKRFADRVAWCFDHNFKLLLCDDVRRVNEAAVFAVKRVLASRLFRLAPYPGWVNTAGEHVTETELDCFPSFDDVFASEFGELDALADYIVSRFLKVEKW